MLGIDQIDEYYDELERLNNDISKEKDEEMLKTLRERRQEVYEILSRDKDDKKFYFNY